MPSIRIDELQSSGSILFNDSESYLTEISEYDVQLYQVQGGTTPCLVVSGVYALGGAIIGGIIGEAIGKALRK